MNAIAIMGPPATGKSTLLNHVVSQYTHAQPFEFGQLTGVRFDAGVLQLGRYDDQAFGGTDRLPMTVIEDADPFVEWAANQDHLTDHTIVFEGDRLANVRFFDVLTDHCDHVVAYFLHVPEDVLTDRHDRRDDDQDQTWLDGRHTKYRNLRDDLSTYEIDVVDAPHENEEDLTDLTDEIQAQLPEPIIR